MQKAYIQRLKRASTGNAARVLAEKGLVVFIAWVQAFALDGEGVKGTKPAPVCFSTH